MNSKRKILQKRNAKIFNEFKKLFNEKGLRLGVINSRLSERYFLAPETIEKIIKKYADTLPAKH